MLKFTRGYFSIQHKLRQHSTFLDCGFPWQSAHRGRGVQTRRRLATARQRVKSNPFCSSLFVEEIQSPTMAKRSAPGCDGIFRRTKRKDSQLGVDPGGRSCQVCPPGLTKKGFLFLWFIYSLLAGGGWNLELRQSWRILRSRSLSQDNGLKDKGDESLKRTTPVGSCSSFLAELSVKFFSSLTKELHMQFVVRAFLIPKWFETKRTFLSYVTITVESIELMISNQIYHRKVLLLNILFSYLITKIPRDGLTVAKPYTHRANRTLCAAVYSHKILHPKSTPREKVS